MKPSSCKAKGRLYQQEIVQWLMEVCGFQYLTSTSMGASGSDIGDVTGGLPWMYTETKHLATSPSLVEVATIMEKKKIKSRSWCFFTRQNNRPTLVVMPLEILEKLLLAYRKGTV